MMVFSPCITFFIHTHIVIFTKNGPAVNAEWHLQSLLVKINKEIQMYI